MAKQRLAHVKMMTTKNRNLVRAIRPLYWTREGLQVPAEGKWRQFYVTHTDLITWAGGERKVRLQCNYAEDAEKYLWGVYERDVPHIYKFFNEVGDPSVERLRVWCFSHFPSRRQSQDGIEMKRIHFYPIENVLRPRGGGGEMQKESLSLSIYERLMGAAESWTNPEYGDSVSLTEAMEIILRNLDEEVALAKQRFIEGK